MTTQQTQTCNSESDAEERSGIPSNHLATWKQKWKIISLIEIFTRNDLKRSFLELLQVKINSIQGEAEEECKDGVSSDQGPEKSEPTTNMAYQCKPDLSCWSYLPPSIVEKVSKIKK